MMLKQRLPLLNEMASREPQWPEARGVVRLVDLLRPCASWQETDWQCYLEQGCLPGIQVWAKDGHAREQGGRVWSVFLLLMTLARSVPGEDLQGVEGGPPSGWCSVCGSALLWARSLGHCPTAVA